MKFTVIIAITLMVAAKSFATEEDLTVGNRKFAIKLFKEIIKNKQNQNIVFSPISVQIQMALITSASRNHGPAIQEIKSILELPARPETIDHKFQELIKELNTSDEDFKLFNANKLYFTSGCSITEWFRKIIRDTYDAETDIINLQDLQNAADKINQWVARKTDNKIVNFISSDGISYATRLFMVNAVYLMGKWDRPFEFHETVPETFYAPNGNKQVAMMNTYNKTYEYFEDSQAKYLKIELLRDGGEAEMVFVLPHTKQGLGALIQNNLDTALFAHAFSLAKVSVSLPRFKITNDLSVKTILNKLGVNRIFKTGVNLDGYNYRQYRYNYITDVYQKVLIEVDESGLSAITPSRLIVCPDGEPLYQYKTFNADHPFLFYIKIVDVIIYAGQVLEP